MKLTIDLDNCPSQVTRAIFEHLIGTPAATKAIEPVVEQEAEPVKQPTPSIFDKPAATSKNSSDQRQDLHGVIFNGEYCADAKEPFYTSGPRKGQWKKRVGVENSVYDDWYESMKPEAGEDESDEEEHAPVNTAGAFAKQDAQPQQQAAPPKALENTGALMQWVSEKQVAGKITHQDVQQAYSQAGVQVADLFPPNDAETIKQRIAAVYGALVGKAGE